MKFTIQQNLIGCLCKGLLDTHAVVHLPSSQLGLEARQRTLTRFPCPLWHREGHKAPHTMICQCVICNNKVPSFAICMFCWWMPLKRPGSLLFSNCRFDDASFGWFQKVRQADAESIISAAFGSHKALRYQDFLKFFLPEASWDMLLSSVKASSLKPFDILWLFYSLFAPNILSSDAGDLWLGRSEVFSWLPGRCQHSFDPGWVPHLAHMTCVYFMFLGLTFDKISILSN